jgi:hypothetical protein
MKSANDFGQGTTIDADNGQVVTPTPMPTPPTTASIINLPPQIATTLCWIGLGFVLCWYFTCRKSSSHRRED